MINRKLLLVIFLLTVTITKAKTYENSSTIIGENVFVDLGRITGLFLQNCWSLTSYGQQGVVFPILEDCLKEKAFAVLTKALQRDNIKVFTGIELVKINNEKGNYSRRMEDNDWENSVFNIIVDIFKTHTLKIHLENLIPKQDVNEARNRHRRRGHFMMPLLMFGVVSMGMLLIPMGFKFLTVLGAKALLLAKMALILTSIQGLKKVATSGINYGLYHSPNPSNYDRHGLEDVPDEELDFLRHKHFNIRN